jgi:6-phosphofructokinase 1
VPNGIGVIKLMGQSAGFLASFVALGSGDVDAVLVPEVPIVLEGPSGILPFLHQRIQEQKYAVVVVAEGAGEELSGKSAKTDAGGNKKLAPIGEFIKQKIEDYFERLGEEATVKYIDPSYTVRSGAGQCGRQSPLHATGPKCRPWCHGRIDGLFGWVGE